MTEEAGVTVNPMTGEPVPEYLPAEKFDLEAMNDEFAVVMVGQKCVILREDDDAIQPGLRRQLLNVEAFRTWMANRSTYEFDSKKEAWKRVPVSSRWLKDPGRRSNVGIVFEPGDDAEVGRALNLWQGFDVEPAPKGDYSPFTEHLYYIIAGENEEIFDYLMAWFAHLMQRPRDRIGTAVALRGGQGTGKTMVGKIIGSLIDAHYLLVDDPRYLAGQFNAHLAQTLLLQADEAFWSGDKGGVGRLKGLITSDYQMIEHKGVDPIRVRNYVRLMVSSNERWVVPAGRDERRWLVVDVSQERAQDSQYFGELNDHFFDGEEGLKNRAALLHRLLTFDLNGVDLRRVPRTDALLQQKIPTLSSEERWWLDRLTEGATLPGEGWILRVPKYRVRASYDSACDRMGIKHRPSDVEFGIQLKTLVPGIRSTKVLKSDADDAEGGSQRRVWAYIFPPLSECREAFDHHLAQPIDWPADHDEGELDP